MRSYRRKDGHSGSLGKLYRKLANSEKIRTIFEMSPPSAALSKTLEVPVGKLPKPLTYADALSFVTIPRVMDQMPDRKLTLTRDIREAGEG